LILNWNYLIIHKYLLNKIKGETKMFPKFLILNFAFLILFALQIEAAPFTDNGDGTVKDNATGLIWQKCSKGQTGLDCSGGAATTSNWATAITDCSGLSLASKTWRLPHVNELKTIVDSTKATSPAIDTTAFSATVVYYWSSTTYAPTTTNAWAVSFLDGYVNFNLKTNLNYVRCVSGP
jgi:hypothetical protein